MHVAHTGHACILDYVIEQGEVLDAELLTGIYIRIFLINKVLLHC
jgi:hypothetical protein